MGDNPAAKIVAQEWRKIMTRALWGISLLLVQAAVIYVAWKYCK